MSEEKKSKGLKNLRPFSSVEEARAKGAIGGVKSGEARRAKKLLSDILLTKLTSKVNGTTVTHGQALIDAWVVAGMNGDIKAITSIVDRIEGKPVQQVQVQGNVDVAQALLSARKQVTQDE